MRVSDHDSRITPLNVRRLAVSEANPNTSDIVIVGMPPAFAGADDALIPTYVSDD